MGLGGISIWQLIILVVLLWPIVHVLISDRSHGGAKFGWFLAVLFFSWFAFAIFLIVTQGTKDSRKEPVATE